MDNSGGPQDTMVPPVEGVAGGGTSYGWGDGSLVSPSMLVGTIDPSRVPSAELVHVWCMPSTANVGTQEMPRQLEPVSLLAARNERESVQIAVRPKISWAGSSIAGVVQIQCSDLCSTSGDRLITGESMTFRRVVPVLGVPDALVPFDQPNPQIILFPGETTAVWVSFDVPSSQPPGHMRENLSLLLSKQMQNLQHNAWEELRSISCTENLEDVST